MKILIAEDNESNRIVLQRFIEFLNHDCDLACDGKEAVEKFEKNVYDLIFMDCEMPIFDGYQVSMQIRKFEQGRGLKRTPIIALTAHASLENEMKCKSVGMDDYIYKPVTLEEFRGALERWKRVLAQREL